MANRHLSRSIAMQSLFEWDFNSLKEDKIHDIVERNASEFAAGLNDLSFINTLIDGVLKKKGKLDEIITKAAPDWPIEKISVMDRNILRIGLFELLYGDKKEVPPKVAINEAIELAKQFGGDTSGKFVNGVLGAVYKELGEPGKNEVSKKKNPNVPYEKMPIEKLGGAVVYAKDGDAIYLALVHDIFGHWTLSKGKLEKDESIKEGTKREIKEELGVDIKIIKDLGNNEYIANDPEIGKKRKQVHYSLGETKFQDLKLGSSGGLDDAQWFKLADVVNLNIYDDILPIITKAINILLKQK